MTKEELKNLRDSGSLLEGEVYEVEDIMDYSVFATALSESELDKAMQDKSGQFQLLYDIDKDKVEYLYDNKNNIEGDCDWTKYVTNSQNIYMGENEIVVDGCKDITIGDGNVGTLTNCNNLTIGDSNTVTLTKAENMAVGDGNTITLTSVGNVEIGSRNSDITLEGFNIIGSDNSAITIKGDSNIVKNGCIDANVSGYGNTIRRGRYIALEGGLNALEDVSAINITDGYANDIASSATVTVETTNNNTVFSDNLTISEKDAFMDYTTVGNVRRATDKVSTVNLQADNNARTLIVDEMKFRGESETKSDKKYTVIDGVWTETK